MSHLTAVDNPPLRYYVAPTLSHKTAFHGFLTRRGGFSTSPWCGLNTAVRTADPNSERNRERVFQILGWQSLTRHYAICAHDTTTVFCEDHVTNGAFQTHADCDSIFSATPGTVLAISFADCLPILVLHRNPLVVGLIHAGWQGVYKGIIPLALERMRKRYSISVARIHSVIGPSVCRRHYRVADPVQADDSQWQPFLHPVSQDSFEVDLRGMARQQLLASGITVDNLNISEICTYESEEFFSVRRDGLRSGRFMSFIGIGNQ